MKRPENFRKIDGITFGTKTGNTYKFSMDGHSSLVLWIFSEPRITKYSLAIVIDWEHEIYEIKRAERGDGKNWTDVLHQGNFTSQPMKTMDSFVDWVHNRIIQFEYYYNKL